MTLKPQQISIEDYDFPLSEELIAKYPLDIRDMSKLLVYSEKKIQDAVFNEIPSILDQHDVIILNDTRVIPARLMFQKITGGLIELFCLEPVGFSHQDAMHRTVNIQWKCLVGGAKKWKEENDLSMMILVDGKSVVLDARKISRTLDHFVIEFSWSDPSLTFSEILHQAGQIPLPPYFNRETEDDDLIRYQTVFAVEEGSVAAPTAGLHFTDELLNRINEAGIIRRKLTLHVGAGTFRPVSAETLEGHHMHSEIFSVEIDLIRFLAQNEDKRIIAVGTTTTRTLESLYWFGVKILMGSFQNEKMPALGQWEAYELPSDFKLNESLNAIIQYCQDRNIDQFTAATAIMIAPGFQFRICNGLITNFHLPKSTLLLLVSALVGDDWKKIYSHALNNNYRFLSYGDSSILIP